MGLLEAVVVLDADDQHPLASSSELVDRFGDGLLPLSDSSEGCLPLGLRDDGKAREITVRGCATDGMASPPRGVWDTASDRGPAVQGALDASYRARSSDAIDAR